MLVNGGRTRSLCMHLNDGFLRMAWLSLFNRTWSIWFGWQYPKYFEFVTFWSIVNTWAACTIYPVLATTAKALKSITSHRIMVCMCNAQLFVGFGSFDQSSYQISMNQKWHTDNGECDLLCGCGVFTEFNYRLCIWHVLLKCERAFIPIALQQQKKYFPVKIRGGKQLVLCICHFACQFAVKIARIMTLLKVQVGSNIPYMRSHKWTLTANSGQSQRMKQATKLISKTCSTTCNYKTFWWFIWEIEREREEMRKLRARCQSLYCYLFRKLTSTVDWDNCWKI